MRYAGTHKDTRREIYRRTCRRHMKKTDKEISKRIPGVAVTRL